MENRFDHSGKVFYDNEHTLRETHRLLSNIHGVVLGMIESCAEYRFEVVDADKWFNRITGGGGLSDLEDALAELRDWSQEAHVNVRMALDGIEERNCGSGPDDEE